MKAKVIKTGEIINVIPMDGGWAANFINGARHFEDSELDFNFEDWEKFRREVAKDILCAMIHHQNSTDSFEVSIAINIVPNITVTIEQKYYFFKPYKNRRIHNFPLKYSVELYSTYEDACEAAIKYCLENLI